MDPFEMAAMEGAGLPPLPGGLPGGPLDASAGPSEVQCRVCQTVIDAGTGEPLGPVDRDAQSAVAQFVAGGGSATDAEFGGVEL